jgi:hypothetical protein
VRSCSLMCSARQASRPGRGPPRLDKTSRRRVVFARVFYSCHGGAAPELMVLSGMLPERARVGAGTHHPVVDAVHCPPARAAREHGPGHIVVHCDATPELPVGVVPAAARPGRVIHGPLRPPILDGLAAFVADALPGHWGSPG